MAMPKGKLSKATTTPRKGMKVFANQSEFPALPGALPNMEFFRPTEEGLDWLVEFLKDKQTPLFEVGAGTGLLSHLLFQRGIKIVPMDIAPRENPHITVMLMDATEFPFPEGSWIVIARPCHGSFVSGVVSQAKERGCAGVLYIGKEDNVDHDLDSVRSERQTWDGCGGPLGEDEEHAWLIPFRKPVRKPGAVKACVVADPVGSSLATPEEEAFKTQEEFEEALGVQLDVVLVDSPYNIPAGTQVVFYDFGGMMGCDGMMQDNSREVIRWAQDHPSSLVVVVSEFTYRNFLQYELEALGLGKARRLENVGENGEWTDENNLHNLVVRDFDAENLGVPEWFMATVGK